MAKLTYCTSSHTLGYGQFGIFSQNYLSISNKMNVVDTASLGLIKL